MGPFDIFKKKDPTLKKVVEELQDKVAPGGKEGLEKIIDELMVVTEHRCRRDILQRVYLYQSTLFTVAGDKSKARIVGSTLMRKDLAVDEKLANQVYDYILKRFARENYKMADDRLLDMLGASLGNVPMNCTGDVINGATGPYGLSPDNPIPVRGIPQAERYLSHLRTSDGQKVTWTRFGSFRSSVSDHPVDMYILLNSSGKEVGRIFISAYQAITSLTAPDGLLYVE